MKPADVRAAREALGMVGYVGLAHWNDAWEKGINEIWTMLTGMNSVLRTHLAEVYE